LRWRTALTAFGKRLNDCQVRIERYGITIFNEDKLQFYLKQMYASNHLDKKKMTEWENKPKAIKNSFAEGMTFFEGLVRDYKVYEHNSGGTAGKHSFESANQATKADCSNKLQQYIAGIIKAVVIQEEQATNIHNSTKVMTDAMTAQIKAMFDQVSQFTRAIANKKNSPNSGSGGDSSGSGGSSGGRNKGQARREEVQYNKLRTMGSYCLSHGFHPAGVNHTSATCSRRLSTHDAMTTWNGRKGGSVYWPWPIHISVEQQSHAFYAGKSALTN
jgi:hypothetical protein